MILSFFSLKKKKRHDFIIHWQEYSFSSDDHAFSLCISQLWLLQNTLKNYLQRKNIKKKKEEKENTLKNSIRKIVTWLCRFGTYTDTELKLNEKKDHQLPIN